MKCTHCGLRRKADTPLCNRCYRKLPARLRGDLYWSWKFALSHLGDDAAWSRYMGARRVALVALRRSAQRP